MPKGIHEFIRKINAHNTSHVTAVDGDKVTSSDELRELVDAHDPGDSVALTVSRNGDIRTLRVVLGTRPTA